MTKRVPPHGSFNSDDGNPDDKRPRREEMVSENWNHPSSSTSHQQFQPNELPSNSTTSVLSSTNFMPSAGSNGNFFTTNGSNGHQENNGMMYLPSMGHSNNLEDVFSNGDGAISSIKCSICLWPVGSPRCYHHSHHRPHQLSTR